MRTAGPRKGRPSGFSDNSTELKLAAVSGPVNSPSPSALRRPLGYLNDEVAAYRFGLGLDTPPPHVRPELWRRLNFWRARGYRLPAGIFVIPGGRP